jgi:NADPH:quinone reductase-like Zn-dependent oxidoreductase
MSRLAADALPLLAEGRITVPVDETFPLERAQDAYERFRAGGKFGKLVLCL